MKALLTRLLKLENAFNLVVIIVAAMVATMQLRGGDVASAAILGMLGLLATALLVERVGTLRRVETSLEEIKHRAGMPVIEAFYTDRSQLPRFEDYIAEARHEIFAVASGFGYLITSQLGSLEKKAREGCSVKLLMMSPGSEGQVNPLLQPMSRILRASLSSDIITYNLNRVLEAKRRLPAEVAARIEVRVHKDVTTLAVILVDAGELTGRIRVELMPYRFDSTERPSFEVRRHTGGLLYSLLHDRYRELWDGSEPWGPEASQGIGEVG